MSNSSVFNWSGGKDSTLCLHYILQERKYNISTLLTTLSGSTNRISMHGVRQELLVQQALSLDLPLRQIMLPEDASMSTYNQIMESTLSSLKQQGITHAIYGDINLEDLRKYREEQLKPIGLQAVFPLWGKPTDQLVREFLMLGYKAVVVCVNARLLDKSFAGRILDEQFLKDLPADVDPCGENGEFHTFVYDGPVFKKPVKYQLGERVLKTYGSTSHSDDNSSSENEHPTYDTGFWFCDLQPV